MTLRPTGPPVARIIPVYLSDSNGIPAPVTGRAADVILDRLTRLSASFGAELTRSGDQAWLGSTGDRTRLRLTQSTAQVAALLLQEPAVVRHLPQHPHGS